MPTARLPPELIQSLGAGDGLLRATDCRQLGITSNRIDRLVRQGLLVTVAKGVYAEGAVVAGLGPWPRFALHSRAFVLASPSNTFAADWSAVALHEMPTMQHPPPVPSAIRLGSRGSGSNRTAHGRTRFAAVPDCWLADAAGVPALHPAFAAVDIGRRAGRLTALMLADAAAARDGNRENLTRALADISRWPRHRHAAWAVENCDPDVESPLESAGRLAFLTAGLPPSLTNVWVGEFVPEYRIDHYWPEYRLGVEGDGFGKYLLADPAKAMRNEKKREWDLQMMGIRVIRYTWPVASRTPHALVERVGAAMALPPLPPAGAVRIWSSREGAAILGLPVRSRGLR